MVWCPLISLTRPCVQLHVLHKVVRAADPPYPRPCLQSRVRPAFPLFLTMVFNYSAVFSVPLTSSPRTQWPSRELVTRPPWPKPPRLFRFVSHSPPPPQRPGWRDSRCLVSSFQPVSHPVALFVPDLTARLGGVCMQTASLYCNVRQRGNKKKMESSRMENGLAKRHPDDRINIVVSRVCMW